MTAVSLVEARATTHRVARTFSLACRLLPRGVRDDVYWLYFVFRTLDDLVDEGRPEAAERVAAVEDWASGLAGPSTPEVEILTALEPTPRASPRSAAGLLRRDARGPRGRRASRPRPTSTAIATAWRGRSGS